jgi:nucleoside-diphosphate-sugar epimerase
MAALQKGELVLITGGTGWLGSHIANEALAAGLRIRLAIRSEVKAKQLVEALEKLHGKGRIETVVVQDFVHDGAYNEAIKGVHGVVHAATDITFSDNRDVVVGAVLKAYKTFFDAARSEQSVRRVVITSSSTAVGHANTVAGSKTQHLDASVYHEEVVEQSISSPSRGNVYAASKCLSEKYAMSQSSPELVVTAIVPDSIVGAPVPGYNISSSGKWLEDLANGKDEFYTTFGPIWQVGECNLYISLRVFS